MNVIISGANGFIGSHLKSHLKKNSNFKVISLLRNPIENINTQMSYEDFFRNKLNIKATYFIHLASPNFDYCNDNSINDGITVLTKKILKVLPKYQCKNFIFFSTIKVYGESDVNNHIHKESSKLNPITDYAKAKAEAEMLIKKECYSLNINYVIYRLPFVYGPGMKSNISKLIKIIDLSLPIPIFNTKGFQKKSFLTIENIKTVITKNLIEDKSINNTTLNLSDFEPISLFEFLEYYKTISKSKSIIISLPKFTFNIFIKIPILNNIIIKIFGDFQIDNSKIIKVHNGNIMNTFEGISSLLSNK
tara:strand:+ start:1013 stop:1927 length:915 start_codon:yes stop_codon:yes gene_type:complete